MENHVLEDYGLLRDRRDHAAGRLETLRQRVILTEDEEDEVLRLERRLTDLEPHLEAAQRAVEGSYQSAKIADVEAAWPPWMAEKRTIVVRMTEIARELHGLVAAYKVVHRKQEAGLEEIGMAAALGFPSPDEVVTRLASRMTPALGWTQILCDPTPRVASPDALLDSDPGASAFPARAVARLENQRRR
jgi:hypothetical protein